MPTDCYEFKETNIKLPNEKVIVILKIEKSKEGPHQYEDKFWKRVANGNAIMSFEEIKHNIIKSLQSDRILFLLEQEGIIIKDIIEAVQIVTEHGELEKAITYMVHLKYGAFTAFLYNHANYYKKEIQEDVYYLTFELERMIKNSKIVRDKEDQGYEKEERLNIFKINIEGILGYIDQLSKNLGLNITENGNFKELAKKYVKGEIAKAIKESQKK